MTKLDLAVFLVAGGVGTFWSTRIMAGIIGVWALLAILGVTA